VKQRNELDALLTDLADRAVTEAHRRSTPLPELRARAAAAPADRLGRMPVRRRTVGTVVCTALILVLVAAAVVTAHARGSGVGPGTFGRGGAGRATALLDRPFTMLVVGRDDSRIDPHHDKLPPIAHTLMLVRVEPEAGRVRLVSVPVDLQIERPGGAVQIGEVMAEGREALTAAVRDATGIPVDHYAEVSFGEQLGNETSSAFMHLVDAAGGLTFAFTAPVSDGPYHDGRRPGFLLVETPGCYTLSGRLTMQLLEGRFLEIGDPDGTWHTDYSLDAGRMVREQVIIEALLRGAGRGQLDLGELLHAAQAGVTLDDQLDVRDLEGLAGWAATLGPDAFAGASLALQPRPGPVLPLPPASPQPLAPGAAEAARAFLLTGGPTPPAPAGVPDLVHAASEDECPSPASLS
jgi:anionic cell wall polymer biosynthesis LytR-Cps2A-Psr (LCP) family protein